MHVDPAIPALCGPHGAGPRLARLVGGTMVTTDIAAARYFYERFLGFDCVRYAPDRLLLRDRYAQAAMDSGDDDFFVIDVQQVPEIFNPQRMLHHWGLDVASASEVDRIHAEAKARKQEFGLTKVFPVSQVHGSHSFYFADRDSNWWEIEYRLDGLDNEGFFARGDIGSEQGKHRTDAAAKAPLIDPAMAVPDDLLVGNARLTHGTCEQLQLERSRRFVEEVLHLRCVRHLEPAQMFAGRGTFGVFAIGLPRVKPQGPQNRWILSVDSCADVQGVEERARAAAEELGVQQLSTTVDDADCAFITIQDADGNWWEVTTRSPGYYRDLFAAGDVA